MPNGTTSSLTCPLPKDVDDRGYIAPREVLNAIFYVLRSGCQWRLLPHDFLLVRWPTVYHYFRQWRIDGTWEGINRALRERLRVHLNRDPQPSAGIVDSQSVKTTGVGAEDRGYDLGGKKVKGLKSVICSWTPRASCSRPRSIAQRSWIGTESRRFCSEPMSTSHVSNTCLWVDAGYRGEEKGKEWAEKTFGWSVDLVERPKKPAPRKVCSWPGPSSGHMRVWWSIGRRSCHPRGSWCCPGVGR